MRVFVSECRTTVTGHLIEKVLTIMFNIKYFSLKILVLLISICASTFDSKSWNFRFVDDLREYFRRLGGSFPLVQHWHWKGLPSVHNQASSATTKNHKKSKKIPLKKTMKYS